MVTNPVSQALLERAFEIMNPDKLTLPYATKKFRADGCLYEGVTKTHQALNKHAKLMGWVCVIATAASLVTASSFSQSPLAFLHLIPSISIGWNWWWSRRLADRIEPLLLIVDALEAASSADGHSHPFPSQPSQSAPVEIVAR